MNFYAVILQTRAETLITGIFFRIISVIINNPSEIIVNIFEIIKEISVRTVQNILSDGSKCSFGRSEIFFGPSETKLFSLISEIFIIISEILSVISKIFHGFHEIISAEKNVYAKTILFYGVAL